MDMMEVAAGGSKQKKVLCIASVASNLDNFNRNNVELLLSMGYQVTLAANFQTDEDTNSAEKIRQFRIEMEERGIPVRQIDFSRKMGNLKLQMRSIRQVDALLQEGFDLVHCHSPICSAITRAVSIKYRKKFGMKVVYTAHGFHFYTGAPLKNWLIFYPVEWLMSWFTDTLITINHQDYDRARKRLHARRTEYIHGVGVDTERLNTAYIDCAETRKALGLSKEDIMLLSVGELNENKNQGNVIRALAALRDPRVHYFLAGMGRTEDTLRSLARELGVADKVHLLGFRTDVDQLCHAADLFVFPSIREGLPVALMEAIACRTPVICSAIRGNEDLVKDPSHLFLPRQEESLERCLSGIISGRTREELARASRAGVEENWETLRLFDVSNVTKEMTTIYGRLS